MASVGICRLRKNGLSRWCAEQGGTRLKRQPGAIAVLHKPLKCSRMNERKTAWVAAITSPGHFDDRRWGQAQANRLVAMQSAKPRCPLRWEDKGRKQPRRAAWRRKPHRFHGCVSADSRTYVQFPHLGSSKRLTDAARSSPPGCPPPGRPPRTCKRRALCCRSRAYRRRGKCASSR
jgi:hypothetical protein